MSKILDAMAGDHGDDAGGNASGYQLGTINEATLFPPPPESLLLELDNITGSLISRRKSSEGMTLVFTSATGGEGVSFVSYSVARHLAFLLDGNIAWIDGNYLTPQAKLMGRQPSFRSMLLDPSGAEKLQAGAGLTLVGHGDEELKLTENLTCGHYEQMLAIMRKKFFFTIIDAPAILNAMETAHMARYVDGSVLVVETRRLKYEVVQHGLEQLRSQGGQIFGQVLNKRTYQIPGFLYRKL